jgi:Xaa-Pro aminopeptidase
MAPNAELKADISRRVANVQAAMRDEGFDALVVYGNTKAGGSLRYLTGYFVDRTGWVSFGPTRDDVFVFDAAGVVVPASGDPILLIEPGHMITATPITDDVRGGGLTGGGTEGLTPGGVAGVLKELAATGKVGIETWHRFPAPLYLGMREQLPDTTFTESTVVETVRLVKTPFEIDLMTQAGAVADAGHQALVDAMLSGPPKTELELVRIADHAMRALDPIYEDCVPSSTSLICSGDEVNGLLLHTPLPDKKIEPGAVVNWDVCGRHQGYAIDTSRTRVLGTATAEQKRTYEAVLAMGQAVRDAARPGAKTTDLVRLADDVAKEHGSGLWLMFLGHGIGLDCHERPDMGVEEMTLQHNMVITVEPRLVHDGRFLMANENMCLVTPDGGKPFDTFPRDPLELG